MEESRMVKRTWICVWFVVVVVLLMPLAGCGGDDDPADGKGEKAAKAEKAVDGSFVGEVSGTNALVAVVAAPAEGKDPRDVQVYVVDGRRLSEWFTGSMLDNSFVVESDSGDGEAKGKLSIDSVTGSIELPDGKTVRYKASRPGGAAGLYELTVSPDGELSGASAAGLGVKGEIRLGKRGTGMLRLADGERLEFEVTRGPAAELVRLRAGQVRLIVLPGGQLSGAGKSRPAAGGGDRNFFIRSSST
jgi:hypothetical protein